MDNWCLFVDNCTSLWTSVEKWLFSTCELPPYMGGGLLNRQNIENDGNPPFLWIRCGLVFRNPSTAGKMLFRRISPTSRVRRCFSSIYWGLGHLSTVSTPPTTITIHIYYLYIYLNIRIKSCTMPLSKPLFIVGRFPWR